MTETTIDREAGRRGIAFYVETVVLIVLVMLAATVLVQMFSRAAATSRDASALMGATEAARSCAEAFSGTANDQTLADALGGRELASDDGDGEMTIVFFDDAGGTCDAADAALVASMTTEDVLQGSGTLRTAHIGVYAAEGLAAAAEGTYAEVADQVHAAPAVYELDARSFVPTSGAAASSQSSVSVSDGAYEDGGTR